MKAFRASDGTCFNYNSDFSEVNITVDSRIIPVSGKALLEFVALCWVAPKQVELIEGMTAEEILGMRISL